MRRVDILKMQLLNSRGRFFTASWVGSKTENRLHANMKVSRIVKVARDYVDAEVFVPKYSTSYLLRFPVNSKGDCNYIASDKSKFEMTGERASNF